jgi:uncharacterized protein (DUF58 family)
MRLSFSMLAGAPARIRRWLKPPRTLRPTRAGWLFLLIILGVGFAALNTGNNLLYLVLSLMLAFLVLSGVLSESALRGIRVRRQLPREIFAERENSIQLEVSNSQKRIAAFAVVVEDRLCAAEDGRPLTMERAAAEDGKKSRKRRKRKRSRREESEAAGRSFVLRVGPGESETRRYTLGPARRGALAFSGFRVSTRFPFGLFLKSRDFDCVEETLVYPAVVPQAARPRIAESLASGDTSTTRTDQGGTVSGLREFSDGDSVKRVHWRASLRRGSLLVGEIEDDRDAEVEVRLRARSERPGAEAKPRPGLDRFEEAVSRAASEVVGHLQEGLAVALRTDAVYVPADAGGRQRARLLSFLALVDADGRAPEEALS